MISAFNLIQTYAETFRCEKSARNIIVSSTREFWNFRSKTKSWNFEEVRWRPFSPKESFFGDFFSIRSFLENLGNFFYFINISHFFSIITITNDESVHIVLSWTLKWRVRSCSYNRQSPIFLEKERGIWFSFWFSFWSFLACISVFHWCKWEEG